MYRIIKFSKFFESNLKLGELSNKKRGDILVKKLKNNEPITISNDKNSSNDKNVKIDKMKNGNDWVEPEEAISNITDQDGNYDSDKAKSYLTKSTRYLKVFKDEDENEYQLNQFKKTKEFGSKGAGRLIREFESIQCIFLAIKQAYPNKLLGRNNIFDFFRKYKEITNENGSLLKLNSNVNIDEQLLEDFIQDEDWLSTFYRIPNKLWDKRYKYLDQNELYMIYHVGNKDSDSIYIALSDQYKKFSKYGKFNDINITKWCPADVYLVSFISKNDIIKDIKSTNSISELNSIVDKYFDEKKLLPISLKKINKDSNFKIITNREVDKELPEFEISTLMTNNDPLRGIGSKISTFSTWKYRNNKNVDNKSRVLNLDSSNTSKKQEIDGEVEGSSSRHGKISFNAMKRIIDSAKDQFTFQEIQTTDQLSKLETSQLETIASDLKEKVDRITPDNLLLHNSSPRSSHINGDKNKLISKIQSLQIVVAMSEIYNQDQSVANNIITKIMRYALSIQTDKFDTPRYLRVI
jgi:hypothetical protein